MRQIVAEIDGLDVFMWEDGELIIQDKKHQKIEGGSFDTNILFLQKVLQLYFHVITPSGHVFYRERKERQDSPTPK